MVRTEALPGWHRLGCACELSGSTCLPEKTALALVTPPGSQRRLRTGSPAFGSMVGRRPASTLSYRSVPCCTRRASSKQDLGPLLTRHWGRAGQGKGPIWRQLIHCGHSPGVAGFREKQQNTKQKQNKKPRCPVQLVINSHVR